MRCATMPGSCSRTPAPPPLPTRVLSEEEREAPEWLGDILSGKTEPPDLVPVTGPPAEPAAPSALILRNGAETGLPEQGTCCAV